MQFFCRLCAECKDELKLVSLESDAGKYEEIVNKLNKLNLSLYKNKTDDPKTFPKTVCFPCLRSLEEIQEFIETFNKAQCLLRDYWSTTFIQTGAEDIEIQDPTLPGPDTPALNEPTKYVLEIDATKCTATAEIHVKKLSSSLDNNELTDPLSTETVYQIECVPEVATDIEISNDSMELSEPQTNTVKDSEGNNAVGSWSGFQWACGYCEEVFVTIDLLRDHSKTVHKKCALYRCNFCRSIDPLTFNAFLEHTAQHQNNLRSVCLYCGEIASTSMLAHFRLAHGGYASTTCSCCGEVFPDETSLHEHSYNALKKEMSTTIDMQIKNETVETFKHTTPKECIRKKSQDCTTHDRSGEDSNTDQHEHMRTYSKIKRHYCKYCPKSFLFKHKLDKHVQLHVRDKPYVCDVCSQTFKVKSQIQAHMLTHTNHHTNSCKNCDKKYCFTHTLKVYTNKHKLYDCKECGKPFTYLTNLNKHMVSKHRKSMLTNKNIDVKPKKETLDEQFTCEYCNVKYKNWSRYFIHMQDLHGRFVSYKTYMLDRQNMSLCRLYGFE